MCAWSFLAVKNAITLNADLFCAFALEKQTAQQTNTRQAILAGSFKAIIIIGLIDL
jgi:hypothetical protein